MDQYAFRRTKEVENRPWWCSKNHRDVAQEDISECIFIIYHASDKKLLVNFSYIIPKCSEREGQELHFALILSLSTFI